MSQAPIASPPGPEQLEVTVLGRGKGECVLCHVGEGRWLMVDSFRGADGEPIGDSYLAKLEGAHRIVAVIATHWDDDHTHGMGEVLRRHEPAEVWMPIVLNEREVFRFALEHEEAMPQNAPSGLRDFVDVLEHTMGRGTRRWGIVGRDVSTSGTPAEVTLLAPTDELVDKGLAALGIQLEPGFGEVTSPTSNDTSIVVWLAGQKASALLGADLVAGSEGWTAVVNRGAPSGQRASLIKVPHHGSPDADEPRLWSEMATAEPRNVVTRYTGLAEPRPREADIMRLTGRGGDLHIAGALPQRLVPESDQFDRHLEVASVEGLRPAHGPVGCVRARVREAGEWEIDAFGAVEARTA